MVIGPSEYGWEEFRKSVSNQLKGHYLAAVVVVDFYQQVMKREHQKMRKKNLQGKQYLMNQIAFTERNCVGCLLFSPTFIIFSLFIIKLLQTWVPLKQLSQRERKLATEEGTKAENRKSYNAASR